jgi:hypothetical protein
MVIKKWADTRNIKFVIRLDHSAESDEYEEVVAFHPETSPTCPLIMWRTAELVFVQPLIGRRRRYGSVAKALDSQVMTTMPYTVTYRYSIAGDLLKRGLLYPTESTAFCLFNQRSSGILNE